MFKSNKVQTAKEKQVWSIPLNSVIIPALMAGNVTGAIAINREVLGAPLRLAVDKTTKEPKFNKKGDLVIKVHADINAAVKAMRENFIAQLKADTETIAAENPDAFKAEVVACAEAGKPIIANETKIGVLAIDKRNKAIIAEAIAHADAETADDATPAASMPPVLQPA
jgi:cell envelope opacity-associated protein A